MKIETIIGRMPEGVGLGAELAEVLNLPPDENGTVEAVMVVGGWTAHARSRARWARRHFIPVMHVPLGMLAPWEKPSAADMQLSAKVERLVATGDMEDGLLDGGKFQNKVKIYNSLVTVSISREEMVSLFQSQLVQLVQEMDKRLKDRAQHSVEVLKETDGTIQEVLRQLYYMKDLDTRGMIPETTMKKFAETLTKGDFNEDHFEKVTEKIHLRKFMVETEKKLFDKGWLTEGFMPVMVNGL